MVSAQDLKRSNQPSKVNTKIVYDMKLLMKHVERAGRDAGVWITHANDWTSAATTLLYEKIIRRFKIPSARNRVYERILWKTYLNMVKKNKGLVPLPSQDGIETRG